ncbi:MAG: TonB-dependent receptor domain-containing protein [Allosphingosinicella sp.]|uniref:TonB-dependent receptor domain-containing protein n=1 Tax=Allosphingosinicella sp. TaxID=2823234 RepID=UPI00392500F4
MTIRHRVAASASLFTLAIAVAAPAQAQTETRIDETTPQPIAVEDASADSIVVTGSRIPRANFDTAQPAVVLGNEQIEMRGVTNIGEALMELPAFGVPGGNRVGGQAGAFGSGQTFINFFGLGDQRTLTVVNGRRFVSSNTASIFGPTGAGSQVDFNVIPTLLVDRVETVAVGGAPIYGSDAIAGTVNIITRRDFNGAQIDAQYGISQLGDAPDYRIRGIVGRNFAGGRGNITVAGEYNEASGLEGTQRPGRGLSRFFTSPLGQSEFRNVLIQDRRIPALAEFGAPLVSDFFPLSPGQAAGFGGYQPSVVDAQGNPLVFDRSGNLVPLDFGRQTGNIINFDGGGGFSLPENLLSPVRRYLGAALAQFELTPRLRAFGEAWYANSRGTQLRDQPVYNTALFDDAGTPDGNFIISIDNPFLTPQARAIIADNLANNPNRDFASQDFFYLGRANTDLATGLGYSEVQLQRYVLGIDGSFDAFGRDLQFELVGVYGRSATEGRERVVVQQNLENALNAVRDASGNIVCAPGYQNASIATLSSVCVPFNPFGQQVSRAAIDYITTIADPRAVNDQWVGTASVGGSLFDIWGGPVGFALGVEHRRESSTFDPGAFYFGEADPTDPNGGRNQYGRSIPIDPVSGSFRTNEVFGELTVPLLGRGTTLPLVHSLELNGAARYIDHSYAGGDLTWTAGATWQPVRDLTVRGNFTRSVRAPAITELFNPTSQIFTTAQDPCDSRFRNAGPDPARRQANCLAHGLGPDFQSNIVDFTTRGELAGNPNLDNEKADSWTIGAVLRPRFLPRFTASVDWIDISLQGAIQSLDATSTLQACYDAPDFPAAVCNQFERDANGQIPFIRTGYANAASRQFRGLVSEVAYRLPTPFLGADSSVNLGLNYMYIDRLQYRVGQGDITTLRNSIGYSPHQATANITYRNDNFSWLTQLQYIGSALFNPDEAENNRDIPGVGDVMFVNTTLAFDVNERFGFRLIVDNLLDTRPPYPAPGGGGRITYFDGLMGRYFKVGASIRF